MNNMVYVVDDDPSMRTAITRLLKSVELNPCPLESAEDFLAIDRATVPCCLVLDVRMPNMSGLELQRLLSQMDPDLPIIFVTAHADVRMAVGAMKTGAVEFLAKPFEDQDLLNAVHQALVRHERVLGQRGMEKEAAARLKNLSRREREVLQGVVRGRLNKQIAQTLGITEKTVKAHRARVMRKMAAPTLADLVRIAQRAGVEAEEAIEQSPA